MKFDTSITSLKQTVTRNKLQDFDLDFEELPITNTTYSKLKRLMRRQRTKTLSLESINRRLIAHQ